MKNTNSSLAALQELSAQELHHVNGGFLPILIAAAALLSGCATTHGPKKSNLRPDEQEP